MAVGLVARYVEKPGKLHRIAVKHILRYLKGTTTHGITYHRNDNRVIINTFCDADWAGNKGDRKSTMGYVIIMANAAISWKSAKQACTALSSVEAEYIAAATAAK